VLKKMQRSKHKATCVYLLLCIFLSTKGAYYGANYLCLLICIFLSTKDAYYGAKHLLSTRGAYGT
jgi:hypothetical protein